MTKKVMYFERRSFDDRLDYFGTVVDPFSLTKEQLVELIRYRSPDVVLTADGSYYAINEMDEDQYVRKECNLSKNTAVIET
jgi:hypothetical protein